MRKEERQPKPEEQIITKNGARYYESPPPNEASLFFTIHDIINPLMSTIRKFMVKTSIQPLGIPEDNNHAVYVNITTKYTAIYIAFKKGIKKLRRGLISKRKALKKSESIK